MAQRKRKGNPPPTRGGNNTVFYIVLGVIAVAGVLAIAYALTGGGGTAATEPIELQTASTQELFDRATPVTLGDPSAPAKIIEFADFQCPGCAAFALQGKPQLMPFIEGGQAQLVFYDFPLGGNFVHGFLAARAARCAGEQQLDGQDAYWAMHDKLFREQPNWSAERDASDDFVEYAAEIGLDRRAFEQCLRSDRYAEVVTANRLLGDQLGVSSTPTVLINNRQVGGRNISDMVNQLVGILREMNQAEPSGGE